jgi:stage II sporulation protein AA (anti-sigma F factor antagonist)
MGMDRTPTRFTTETRDGVTVVLFTGTALTDPINISKIGGELKGMVNAGGVREMLVSMQSVRYLSSAVLTQLILLHKALRMHDGELKLCNIAPTVMEVFRITRLDRVFDIFESESEALRAFRLGS